MKSKTIIIQSQTNKSGRGILTLYEEEDLLKCKLRLYNTEKLTNNCKLGLYHNNQVYSANLLEKSGVYESSLVGEFNLSNDFYTAIVDTANENRVLLSGGTYNGCYFEDSSVITSELSQTDMNISEMADIHQNNLNLAENVDNLITQNNLESNYPIHYPTDCNKCASCIYKEYFYNHENNPHGNNGLTYNQNSENTTFLSGEVKANTPLKAQNNENSHTQQPADLQTHQPLDFQAKADAQNLNNQQTNSEEINETMLSSLIPQFNYVFENYPPNTELNSLIENGKFVEINEAGESYSIGAIYQQDKMKYICYAIKCNYNATPPKELGEHYQWLPTDSEDPLSEGYYIVYQDAEDLKILEV